jgi:hypothetical protein
MTVRNVAGQFVKGAHAYRTPQPHWQRDWLVREYVELNRSTGEIAAWIGCTDANVLFWLGKHGITRRTISESRAIKHWGVSGEANPMFGRTGPASPTYVDGSSPERQRLYVQAVGRDFLKRIYERDGFKCVRCSAPKRGPRSIHVHHIKPWAGNVSLRFDETNVATLCRPCHQWVHSKANASREYLA